MARRKARKKKGTGNTAQLAIVMAAVFVAGLFTAWLFLRDDGFIEQVTAARVEQVLLSHGVPDSMAACMAPKLADRLSIEQLEKLNRIAPRDGEFTVPVSAMEALKRMRRVEDGDAVEQLARVSTVCGYEVLTGQS
ncbi:MAG: hypothetical protein AAFY47_11280 [Pseudomonadota bacterium]